MGKTDRRSITSKINGKKGGVKTPEGKVISSQNAVKHGIFAKYDSKLDDSTPMEVYEYYAEEFGDETTSRSMLISQLAILHIRLRRCLRYEQEFLVAKANPPKFERQLVKAGIDLEDLSCESKYETVMVDPGKPMSGGLSNIIGLEKVYINYEGQFLKRFCTIVDFLQRTKK